MRCKATYYLTKTIATVLVFAAASSSAASLFPLYVAGGLVNWSSVDNTIDATSFQDSPIAIPLESVRATSEDTGYRISAGYSFNETWSVEGAYVAGPTQTVTISDIPLEGFGNVFRLDSESTMEITVFRLNPVYEYMLRDPISVQLKVGIAQIRAEIESATSVRSVSPGGTALPRQSYSESRDETKPFAATALKLNFRDGKVAVVASLVQYYDAPGGLGQALELDLFWRF